jgi:hypothetical protein
MPETTETTETTKTPDPKRFFVVWSPQGGPPVVRFPNFGAARSAAIRLSLKHPEQDFFVLQSCWGKIGEPVVGAETGPLDPDPPGAESEVTP